MKTVELTGKNLSIEDVYTIAHGGARVSIAPKAWDRVVQARQILDHCASHGVPIYGYNEGVGWNKDKKVAVDYYHEFNRNLLYAHAVSVGPLASPEEVRGMLLVRLNTALTGGPALSPCIVKYYEEFLNRDILPDVPRRGSVGQSDIVSLAHIGLAFIGEGQVLYQGRKTEAMEALRAEGLQPIKFAPKDGSGIVISNAQSASMASLLLYETKKLVSLSNLILCLGMEGTRGMTMVIGKTVNELRGFDGQITSAAECREFLKGSYLFDIPDEEQTYSTLSYADGAAVAGSVYDAVGFVEHFLERQLNTSDDNPCVIPEENQVILGSPNYEPTSYIIGVEMVNIALSHLSKVCTARIVGLANPALTGLPRELSPDEEKIIAYSITQYPATALDAKIRSLANPSSMDMMPVSGGFEDHATNSVFVMEKLEEILDSLRYIMAIEAIQAAQAVDLQKSVTMGKATGALYRKLREHIPFLSADRCHSNDIRIGYQLIKDGNLFDCLKAE